MTAHPAKKKTVLTAGFAQMPKGTPLFEAYTMIGCILIIDVEQQVIVDAGFTFLMEKTSEFLAELLRGMRVDQGFADIHQVVSEHFLAPGQGAVLQAIRAAVDRYHEQIKL
ncbi:DUF3870 domain-containing protein [Brevibacillus migulae]|uniref:DUF3870 domain-containing protein n=1 Tax=Brevibacillus migulae TaxID=1644114 RepID=UPI00106EEE6C|nr:DUF3870 domain-containing protein [Brevibacillus migulae]